jgi:hypothetical protein
MEGLESKNNVTSLGTETETFSSVALWLIDNLKLKVSKLKKEKQLLQFGHETADRTKTQRKRKMKKNIYIYIYSMA